MSSSVRNDKENPQPYVCILSNPNVQRQGGARPGSATVWQSVAQKKQPAAAGKPAAAAAAEKVGKVAEAPLRATPPSVPPPSARRPPLMMKTPSLQAGGAPAAGPAAAGGAVLFSSLSQVNNELKARSPSPHEMTLRSPSPVDLSDFRFSPPASLAGADGENEANKRPTSPVKRDITEGSSPAAAAAAAAPSTQEVNKRAVSPLKRHSPPPVSLPAAAAAAPAKQDPDVSPAQKMVPLLKRYDTQASSAAGAGAGKASPTTQGLQRPSSAPPGLQDIQKARLAAAQAKLAGQKAGFLDVIQLLRNKKFMDAAALVASMSKSELGKTSENGFGIVHYAVCYLADDVLTVLAKRGVEFLQKEHYKVVPLLSEEAVKVLRAFGVHLPSERYKITLLKKVEKEGQTVLIPVKEQYKFEMAPIDFAIQRYHYSVALKNTPEAQSWMRIFTHMKLLGARKGIFSYPSYPHVPRKINNNTLLLAPSNGGYSPIAQRLLRHKYTQKLAEQVEVQVQDPSQLDQTSQELRDFDELNQFDQDLNSQS